MVVSEPTQGKLTSAKANEAAREGHREKRIAKRSRVPQPLCLDLMQHSH